MPIENGIYTELTFEDALETIMDNAPASIVFSPGNPPELILANMFAQGDVNVDRFIGETLAAMMSPVGANIDLLNPNNPRRDAESPRRQAATAKRVRIVEVNHVGSQARPGSPHSPDRHVAALYRARGAARCAFGRGGGLQ